MNKPFCTLFLSLVGFLAFSYFSPNASENPSFLSENDLYSSLKNQFYIKVPFSVGPSQIDQAKEAFFKFLQQSDDIKNHIQFKLSLQRRRSDVGYQHRHDTDGYFHDNKEFFHFHPAVFEKYSDFLNDNPVVKDFMEKALPLWEAVYDTVYQLLTIFNKQHPGIVDNVFKAEYPHVILRFLKYDWEKAGHHLAKAHFDAGSFTLALAESSPGLRIGSRPENLSLIQHTENEAVFMLGVNVNQLIKDDQLSPSWHDVIQLDQKRIGQPCARWAIVAFIEGQEVEDASIHQTHKWPSN